MKLLIAIPAYNEEASITAIIERSLSARQDIIASSPVTEVEITVVSDGSTDRTVELAKAYADRINLIVFDENRGYGAAIKQAWEGSDAELLGFLDADGTCDPRFFSSLCSTLEKEGADVVLGCRINEESKMPALRRVGNIFFALLLSLFSSARVRDTASGMRVLRRSSLRKLLPLPDGLHFTPAMSARGLMRRDLKIAEIDMPYHEREGKSKLRMMKDGTRFLKAIMDAVFLYRPSRPLAILAIICLAVAVSLMVMPIIHYVQTRTVAEWMIYRFVVSGLAGISACLLLCTSYLSQKMVSIALVRKGRPTKNDCQFYSEKFFSSSFFWLVPITLIVLAGALVFRSFRELIITGATYEHWSRFIVMSFLLSIALILTVTRILDYTLSLIAYQLDYQKSRPPS